MDLYFVILDGILGSLALFLAYLIYGSYKNTKNPVFLMLTFVTFKYSIVALIDTASHVLGKKIVNLNTFGIHQITTIILLFALIYLFHPSWSLGNYNKK